MRPPLIAEQFGMLAALTPGRINLGLGRTPGTAAAGLAVPVLGARFYEKHGCVEFARTEGIPMVGSADVHFRNILTRRLAPRLYTLHNGHGRRHASSRTMVRRRRRIADLTSNTWRVGPGPRSGVGSAGVRGGERALGEPDDSGEGLAQFEQLRQFHAESGHHRGRNLFCLGTEFPPLGGQGD